MPPDSTPPRPDRDLRRDDGSSALPAGDGTVLSGDRSRAPLVATSMEEIGRALEGHALGPYRLDRFVGGGGMGAVFRAVDTTLDRVVAVKVLSRHHSADIDMLRRFKNEAQLAARLDHENIGRVHAVGDDDGWHYIVFEFIEGTNLRDVVLADGPLDVPHAMRFTVQIAAALDHASARGVVHRDIKPSNIIVTPAGRARLVDMGLARLPTAVGTPDLTASGMTLGTFDYISPEQARDPRAADVRSDLYSLGCTLFFMLVGRPPFSEGTLVQKLLQHQQSPPPAVVAERPDVPAGLGRIVSRLLEKEPADRYQHPADLVADLLAVAGEEGIDLDAEGVAGRTGAVAQRGSSSPHWPWVVPVLALLLLVAALRLLPMLAGRGTGEAPRSPSRGDRALDEGISAVARGPAPVRPILRVVDEVVDEGEIATLDEALRLAGDGDVIECAFDNARGAGSVSLTGRTVTLRAAEGFEPALRFDGVAEGAAAVTLASGRLSIDGVGLRVAGKVDAVFAVAPGATLELEDVMLERGGGGGVSDSDAGGVLVRIGPAIPGGLPARLRFRGVQAVGKGTCIVADPGSSAVVEWTGGGCAFDGRFLRLEGGARDAGETKFDLTLNDTTIACAEGIVELLDSATGPSIPTVRVEARRSSFVVESGQAFIEQAGIGTPEAYRSAVRWIDEGSRYEGGGPFRRIDGAAEREELPFPAPDGRRDGLEGAKGRVPAAAADP